MNNRDVGAASALALLLAGFSLAGWFAPTALTWGVHSLGFLPPAYAAAYLALTAAVVIGARNGWFRAPAAILIRFMETTPYQFLVAAIGTLTLAAVLLRVHAPLLGDSFYVVRNFADGMRGTAPLLYRNEPLSTLWYYGVVTLFQPITYAGFLNAFLAAGIALGAGFILCAFFLTKELFADPAERLGAFSLLLAVPYVQLFLGYVETYGAVLLALALYALVAVRALRGKGSYILVAPAFLLLVASHYMTILLAPSLLYAAYAAWRGGKRRDLLIGCAAALAAALLVAWLAGFDLVKYGAPVPHSHFLPLLQPMFDQDEIASTPYTLLSPYHAVDLLNGALLLFAPAIILLVLSAGRLRTALRSSPEALFCAAGLLPVLAFYLVVKFDLGAAKDWDVFAPYTFLALVLAAVIYFRGAGSGKMAAFAIVGGIAFLNTLAFLRLNATTDEAVRRAETLLDRRTVAATSYYMASLHLAQYFHQVQDSTGALRVWENYVAAFPTDPRGYENVITNAGSGGESRARVARAYEGWLTVNPTDTAARRAYARYCLDAGNASYAEGAVKEARTLYEKTIALDPTIERAYNNLGSVYAQEDSLAKAIDCFEAAIELDSTYSDPYYNLGSAYEDRGEKAKGLVYKKAAARLGNAAAQTHLRQKGISW